jgi:hypothetical protein
MKLPRCDSRASTTRCRRKALGVCDQRTRRGAATPRASAPRRTCAVSRAIDAVERTSTRNHPVGPRARPSSNCSRWCHHLPPAGTGGRRSARQALSLLDGNLRNPGPETSEASGIAASCSRLTPSPETRIWVSPPGKRSTSATPTRSSPRTRRYRSSAPLGPSGVPVAWTPSRSALSVNGLPSALRVAITLAIVLRWEGE